GWTAASWFAVATGHPLFGAAVASGAGVALTRELEACGLARPDAARVVADATWWGARQVADAVRRPWWPLALVAAIIVPRARPALLAAVVVPTAVDAFQHRREIGAVEFAVLRLVDDVAYGAGVWMGCVRERSARALLAVFPNGRWKEIARRTGNRVSR